MIKNKNTSKNILSVMLQNFKINFKALLISNLIFSIPFIIVQAIFVFLYRFLLINQTVFLYFIPVVVLSPFYVGLTKVSKEIIIGNKIHNFKTFLSGVKENLKQSLVLGLIYYFLLLLSYFAIAFYYAAGLSNSIFYIMLGFAVVLLILILITLFYVPMITVTVDLSIKNILKNAILMAIYEIPTNFMIIICLAVLVTIISMLFILLSNYLLIILVSCLLSVLIIPVLIAFVISSLTYPKIEKLLVIDKKVNNNNLQKPITTVAEDINNLNLTKEMLKNNDDYIFINGKMIKKSVAKKFIEENEDNQNI